MKYSNNTNENSKRIYSLNLLAYLEMKTGVEAELHNDGNLFYGVLPEGKDVGLYMNQYHESDCQVNLHEFLQAFKDLRQRINTIRGVI